jgi:aminoglycoside phosphotransferase (APT) family kinase protein
MSTDTLRADDLPGSTELLQRWAVEHYGPDAVIEGLRKMPGHGGISFGFDVVSGGQRDPLVIRVTPPGVRRQGNSDVLRQVPILQAMQAEGVPVAEVKWWGEDERWFGAPYFMVERILDGSTFDIWEPCDPDPSEVAAIFRQAVDALVLIHSVPWRKHLDGWSTPNTLAGEVRLWEPTLAKGDEPGWFEEGMALRDLLLARMPEEPAAGIIHGDFYTNNWISRDGRLLAIVDWEISAIGPSYLDIGWLCMMYDPESWGPMRQAVMTWGPTPDELLAMYEEAAGRPVADAAWYRALAAWRLSSITALQYRLHKTGRRHDPTWEILGESFLPMVRTARRLLQ